MPTRLKDLTPEQRLARAKEVSSRLIDHVINVVRLHESNRIVIYTDTLSRQIPHSLAGNAYNDFKDSQFYFEVLRLCALWDDYRFERESIPTALTLLNDAAVQKLVNDTIVESWRKDYSTDSFGRSQAESIKELFRRALKVAENVRSGVKLRRLRNFRNKFLAHSLTVPLDDAPKYGDERRLLNLSVELISRIYLATHNSSFGFESSAEHARKCARELWENCSFSIPK